MTAAKTPNDTQARVMLYLLAGLSGYTGRGGGDNRGGVLDSLWHSGWIDGDDDLTWLGRETIARYLYRTLTGPTAVLPARPSDMDAGTARILVDILAGRDPYEGEAAETGDMVGALRRCGWVYRSPLGLFLSPYGREALACYLLRGWRA